MTGFVLEADVEHFGLYIEILDARNQPDSRTYLFTNVVQG